MERRPLGRGGPEVPVLFLGTWPLGGGMGPVERSTAIATIRRAIDLGITAIDTAEGYGDAEELVGASVRSGERGSLFIATKVSFGPYTRARVRAAAEQSLRRMRTDHLDLAQLHFFPADIELEEALDALAALRDEGLARYVGISNFTRVQFEQSVAHHPLQSLQVPLNIIDQEELTGTIARGHELGIGILCHSALAKGLLSGSLTAATAFARDDERSTHPRFGRDAFPDYLDVVARLASLAEEAGLTLVELALAWILSHPTVTACIAGPREPSELDLQVSGAETRLPGWLLDRVAVIAADMPTIGHGTPTSSPRPPI